MTRLSSRELSDLVGLMRKLRLTEEQMFQMYFMTFDDPFFARSFMSVCSKSPSKERVQEYLDMLAHDIGSSYTNAAYRAFRQTARYDDRRRERGVLERFSKDVIGKQSKPKLKIRLKG